MRKMLWLVLGALLGLSLPILAQDGPLTPFFNLQGRTDENGYLLIAGGTPGVVDGPLTTIGNLRARTDENGYLMVNLTSAESLVVDTITMPQGSTRLDLIANRLLVGLADQGAVDITTGNNYAEVILDAEDASPAYLSFSASMLSLYDYINNRDGATYTAATEQLALPSRSRGTGNVTSPTLFMGRNNSGSGAAGCVIMESRNGTDYALWFADDGDLITGTACPDEDNTPTHAGTVVGSQT